MAEKTIESAAQQVLFPTYARYPIRLVKGRGSWLWDDEGKKYLDFMTGIGVTNLGHVPEAVKKRLVEQLDQLWHVSNLYHIPIQEKLAAVLTENSCADMAFFCNSGAEANEAAIKLARRYSRVVLGKERYEIITFRQSFHGRTLATLTATGQDKVKDGFAPLPDGFQYVPFNDSAALRKAVSEKTCAVMMEMVQGEGGVYPAEERFVQDVVRLCREQDLLLIVDEVQTGMGRTGKLFAHQHYRIEPDIFTLAKGLGSGFPIGAMLGKAKLAEAFGPGSHGSTFGGTPIACAAALATVETIIAERLPERAEQAGTRLIGRLKEALRNASVVKEVRGRGLMVGIECTVPVSDIIRECQERGLLVLTAGPNVIRLLPNLLVTEEELEQGVQILGSILTKV